MQLQGLHSGKCCHGKQRCLGQRDHVYSPHGHRSCCSIGIGLQIQYVSAQVQNIKDVFRCFKTYIKYSTLNGDLSDIVFVH